MSDRTTKHPMVETRDLLEAEVHQLVEALDMLQRTREPLDVAAIAEKLNVLTLLVVRLAHFQLKDGEHPLQVEFPDA